MQETEQENKKRILYVEDHKAFGEIITRLLSEHGVLVATTMPEALSKVKGEKFSLYLVDQNLPGGVSGVDFCRQLRMFDPQTPVLFLTVSPELSEEQVEEIGAQGLIIKGVPKFVERLHEHVSRLAGEQTPLETLAKIEC